MAELNQIVFLSAIIFAIGLAAIFRDSGNFRLRAGTIIAFAACLLNFNVFSNFNTLSIEGQVIGFFILIVTGLHIFIQTKLLNEE